MICIGLTNTEKQEVIKQYLQQHNIAKVIVFYPEVFPLTIETNIETRYVEYKDIIMYKVFYPLLEIIDEKTLLVFNECMRTQNRSELTYNCAHHYCNQTPHKIVFEYFPFIEQPQDFMILLDFINKGKYKGKSFSYDFIHDENVKIKPAYYTVQTIEVPITDKDRANYEKEKEKLFDNLGMKDPDTIPRQLHIWAGNLKKKYIEAQNMYVARNKRFNLPNVITYKDATRGDYIVIDFPHNRIDFNDFLKKTGMKHIIFLNTGLKVDLYYLNELKAWIERLGEFYAKTGVHR